MKFSCLLLLLNFIVLLFAEPIPDTVFATHLAKSVAEAPNRELTLLHKRASPDFQHSLQMFASNQMNLGTFLATQDMAELSSWASSSITSLQKGGCGLVRCGAALTMPGWNCMHVMRKVLVDPTSLEIQIEVCVLLVIINLVNPPLACNHCYPDFILNLPWLKDLNKAQTSSASTAPSQTHGIITRTATATQSITTRTATAVSLTTKAAQTSP